MTRIESNRSVGVTTRPAPFFNINASTKRSVAIGSIVTGIAGFATSLAGKLTKTDYGEKAEKFGNLLGIAATAIGFGLLFNARERSHQSSIDTKGGHLTSQANPDIFSTDEDSNEFTREMSVQAPAIPQILQGRAKLLEYLNNAYGNQAGQN